MQFELNLTRSSSTASASNAVILSLHAVEVNINARLQQVENLTFSRSLPSSCVDAALGHSMYK